MYEYKALLSGMMNGNAGVVKTYIGETTEKSEQIKVGRCSLTLGWKRLTPRSLSRVETNT